MARPRIYGDERRYKLNLGRQLDRGTELLDQLEGVRRVIAASSGGTSGLIAEVNEIEWTDQVERWRLNVLRSAHRHLADQAGTTLPQTTASWPPDTGKPRHVRGISWVEPWLRASLNELDGLRGTLGVRRGVLSTASPSRFAELEASGLIDPIVVVGHAEDMASPRTPKQLADAIGAAKDLAEATLRGALDWLGEPWRETDELTTLMRKWREQIEHVAPPDPKGRASLDAAQAALGNLLRFLAEWRNAYGRGHGPNAVSTRAEGAPCSPRH